MFGVSYRNICTDELVDKVSIILRGSLSRQERLEGRSRRSEVVRCRKTGNGPPPDELRRNSALRLQQ